MRTLFLLFGLIALNSPPSRGGEADAALALARARARAAARPVRADAPKVEEVAADECHDGYAKGLAVAKRTAKPLVVWVGMRCTDQPNVRKAAAGAVHCHADDWEGDRGPYVVVRTPRGSYWRIRTVTPEAVRDALHAEHASAPAPAAVGYVPRVLAPTTVWHAAPPSWWSGPACRT